MMVMFAMTLATALASGCGGKASSAAPTELPTGRLSAPRDSNPPPEALPRTENP
jgi:hypothetical protein